MSAGSLTFDRYMREHYAAVPGMSSAFAAKVCVAVMRLQTDAGWCGNVAEIGAFEGRFLIALALAMQPDEKAIGIDLFDWPDIHVNVRLSERLRRFDLADDVDVIWGDSGAMTAGMIGRPRYARDVRLFHVDGDHMPASLAHDLNLAFGCMEPWGVICLDDMLSPAYPELVTTVIATLRDHPDWSVFCVIDREDIVAQSKFLLCRHAYVEHYTDGLKAALPEHVWTMGAQFTTHNALVLAPEPHLSTFHPGGSVK